MTNKSPKMIGIPVPVKADPVAGPTITYGESLESDAKLTSIDFLTDDDHEDDGWARITFEHLDSIRVSRGEFDPYPCDRKRGDPLYWVYEVVPSSWLLERYEYEKNHYGLAYEFSRDVDEMLRDFSHYVFTFHDQFVEAICAGIWFEKTFGDGVDSRELSLTHPFRNLLRPAEPDRIEAYGIACEIWPNTRPMNEILKDAELCSQKLLQFALVLESIPSVNCTLAVRVRHGKVQSILQPRFGRPFATFDGVAALENVLPYLERWLEEIKERRKQMGKA